MAKLPPRPHGSRRSIPSPSGGREGLRNPSSKARNRPLCTGPTHERSLVNNLIAKAFALIGVNTIAHDAGKLREVTDRERLSPHFQHVALAATMAVLREVGYGMDMGCGIQGPAGRKGQAIFGYQKHPGNESHPRLSPGVGSSSQAAEGDGRASPVRKRYSRK